MSRRLFLVLSIAALPATALVTSNAAKAASTPSGGACQLSGLANFASPGLTSSSSNFKYGFSGSLSGCQSNTTPPSPASGTETAGQPITVNGVSYQEPAATGTGGCSNSTTSGTSITKWADGDYTVTKYTTTGAGAAVALQGSVISGVVVTGTDSTGAPISTTISTNEPSTPVGASAVGELTFSTASPTDIANCAGSGLTSAVIKGLVEIGQA